MSRRVVVLGPRPLGQYGAARARMEGLASAFEQAGWDCEFVDEPVMRVTRRRRWVVPAVLVRFATRVGIAGDIQPGKARASASWARRLTQDVVLVVSVPPFSLILLAAVRRGPTLVDYRDVLSFASRPTMVGALLGPVERWLLRRRVAGVSVAGSATLVERMRGRLRGGLGWIVHVPNGVNTAEIAAMGLRLAGDGTRELEPDNTTPDEIPRGERPLRIVYSGELYGYADFLPVYAVLSGMPSEEVELHVVTPTDPSTLGRYLGSGASNVVVHPAMSRPELYRFLGGCDVGLVVLTPQYPYEDSVPAKYYDYLAVGLQIFYLGPDLPALLDEPGADRVRVVGHTGDALRSAVHEERARVTRTRPPYPALIVDRKQSAARLVRLASTLRH